MEDYIYGMKDIKRKELDEFVTELIGFFHKSNKENSKRNS